MTINTLEIPDDPRGEGMWRRRPSRRPRLTVLFHSDLRRVGATTPPETFDGGAWVTLGRLSPEFVEPWAADGAPEALGDPYLSRQQGALRWAEARGGFEFHPSASARWPVEQVAWGEGGEVVRTRLEAPCVLPPGALVALGDRALLRLEVAPFRGAERDRMGFVGESEALWALREEIVAAALFERPVLILGETGVGKELVARAVHACGERAGGPFVAVNSAALPEQLVESLLFGHQKGAFTGATQASRGLMGDADGGVLFLDELGELPMSLQAKLLRVLQESLYTPVGATRPLPVSLRVVAATHRDPEAHIRAGRLRSDLYYRLAAHSLHVPPLRERPWDVPRLFVHFLEQLAARLPALEWLLPGAPSAHAPVPMAAVVALLGYGWPGNVRELQNVVEHVARLNLQPGPFVLPTLGMSAGAPRREGVAAAAAAAAALSAPPWPGRPQRAAKARAVPLVPARASGDGLAPQASAAPWQPPREIGSATPPHATRAPAPLPAPLVLQAARHLGLKTKTLQRLLDRAEVAWPPPGAAPDADALEPLIDALSVALARGLERCDFNQVRLAEHLGLARSTLLRLMERLDVQRPQDIPLETLQRLFASSGGDVAEMAAALRVSEAGLKMRLTREGFVT